MMVLAPNYNKEQNWIFTYLVVHRVIAESSCDITESFYVRTEQANSSIITESNHVITESGLVITEG